VVTPIPVETEGTAAPADDTAGNVAEATPEPAPAIEPVADVQPDSADATSPPETVPPVAPETAGDPPPDPALAGDPVPPPPDSNAVEAYIDALSDEDFNGLGRVARGAESVRRTTEAASMVREAEFASKEEFVPELQALYTDAATIGAGGTIEHGDVSKGLSAIMDRVFNGNVRMAAQTVVQVISGYYPEGMTFTQGETEAVQNAHAAYVKDPSTAAEWMAAYIAPLQRAAVESAKDGIITEAKVQWESDQKAANTTAELQGAEQTRADAAAPSRGVAGVAGRGYSTRLQMDIDHASGKMSTPEMRKARDDGSYWAKPPQ